MENVTERVIALSPHAAAIIRRPIVGRGGFQSLLRRIQLGLDGHVLVAAEEDLDALVRASVKGGLQRMGGFQQRVLTIIAAAARQEIYGPPPESSQLWLPFRARSARPRLRVIRGGRG